MLGYTHGNVLFDNQHPWLPQIIFSPNSVYGGCSNSLLQILNQLFGKAFLSSQFGSLSFLRKTTPMQSVTRQFTSPYIRIVEVLIKMHIT